MLISERIPPLVQSTREDLLDRFCPEQFRDKHKQSVPDQDCLARIYLGKRRQPRYRVDDRPAHLKHF